MSYRIQPFETLPLKHYFMFGQVFQDPKICQMFLEELFHWPIEKIEYVHREKDLTDSYFAHGVRLDIYIRNSDLVYNVEMQSERDDDLLKRIRYYQSSIDREELKQGVPYRNLPETYVIFICDYDPVGTGRACYERQMTWKDEPLTYDDGTHVILLNSFYTRENTSSAILELLDYIRTNDDAAEYSSELVNQAKEHVKAIRQDKGLGATYMLLESKMQEYMKRGEMIGLEKGEAIGRQKGEAIGLEKGEAIGRQKGEAIGLKKGLDQGRMLQLIEQTCKKLKKGKSASDISDELEQSLSVIQAICKAAKPFAPEYDVHQIYAVLNGCETGESYPLTDKSRT